MKTANKTFHLAPREKQCSASQTAIGLRSRCSYMLLKLGLDLHVFDLNIHHRNTHTTATNFKLKIDVDKTESALGYSEWRMAA